MATAGRRETGIAEVNGALLAYEVVGQGHPLILIHGGLVDYHLWDEQVEAFARHYQVIRYDVRGFGSSSPPHEPFAHHDDVWHLLTFLEVESAYVLGLSLGGGIAIDFALAHPTMVDALVPVSAGLDGYPPSDIVLRQGEAVGAAFARGDQAEAVELLTRMWTDGPQRQPEQIDPTVRARMREMTARIVARPVPKIVPRPLEPAALSRLGEIHVPTLIIVGDQDVPDILASADILQAGVTGARKVVMQGTAHHPNMERPDEFNRIVLEFLGSLRND